MIIDEIRQELTQLQDLKYKDFQSKLIPTVSPDYFIGVRTPDLRKMARRVGAREDVGIFLNALPHTYFDENQLHAFIISGMKNYGECIEEINRFLPYVNNWATCDQMSPKVFRKNRKTLVNEIREWLSSDETYTVRFGVGMLMEHFLDDDFEPSYPEMAAAVTSEEYYVRMMVAWYFATALAKQYDAAVPFVEGNRLDVWTHNKTIQKAIESNRISTERKEYLRTLKRR